MLPGIGASGAERAVMGLRDGADMFDILLASRSKMLASVSSLQVSDDVTPSTKTQSGSTAFLVETVNPCSQVRPIPL